MTERARISRPITPEEVTVIRVALERAPASPGPGIPTGDLETLHVVSRCSCGCDSVDFAEHDPARPAKPIADGIGTTPSGGTVGIIIWGGTDAVTGLEVYDLGAGDGDLKLPTANSIRAFDDSGPTGR